MGWEIHNAKTTFAKFADEWDQLNARLYDSHPFADSRFLGALLDHFGDGSQLLCVHRTGDRLSGGLILQSCGLWRYSSFRPSQRQAMVVLLEDACLLASLLPALPRLTWTIELYAVDPRYAPDLSSVTLPLIIEAQARTIGIELANGFPAYWEKRPKKLAANIARYFRRTEAEFGADRVTRLIDAAEMDTGVGRFGAMESAGWKGQAGTAVSRDNEQGAFYLDILRRFALTNQAAVYEFHIGDQLASSRLVISNDRMLIFLKTTYDESLARFAPGRLLLYRVIEEQSALNSRQAIEFYTNATSDQKEWASFACTVQNVQIFRGPLNAAAFSVLRAWRQNLQDIRNRASAGESISSNVVQCKDIEGLQEYDLGEFAAEDNFQASTGWFKLLEKQVFPSDAGVRYYLTAEKKNPRVILPVRLTTRGVVKSIESLSNYYTALYAPLLSREGDPLDLQKLLAAAVHDHGSVHVIRFSPMDPESATYKGLLSALRANDWIPFQFFCFGNWFLRVEGSWEDYLKKRSANLRSSLKRRCKRFAAEGGTLEVVTTIDDSEQCIAAFQEVYSASWKVPEPYPEFVPSLIRQLATAGMLRLGIARLSGRTIAAQLWIVDKQKASIYKVAYHGDFASYSPGTVLTAHVLQHVIDLDHVAEVDFLIGDDKYKRLWMSDRRERWGIVAYNPATIIGFALLTVEVVGRTIKTVSTAIGLGLSPTGSIGKTVAAGRNALSRIVKRRPAE
ncbi:GNAT family N-acetyltransferase [Candidatus Accumulibacter sp. ACC003]|uniref:GNAT family N-acetyltransferase n=1 Tax=Candidatus Accumulibacter sp. ACC003 TaxID=2823334 RepID=UPI0025BA1769|nr:GNAT family N-acetyltransferase [Candidatus Accumulibacter sp. ACC003]